MSIFVKSRLMTLVAGLFVLGALAPEAAAVSDLAVTKTVSDAEPSEGAEIVYTVLVTNTGPDPATGVTVDDMLPSGVTFVQVDSVSQGSYDDMAGAWTVGALANGVGATLELRASVDAGTASTTGTGDFIDSFVFVNFTSSFVFGPDGNLYVSDAFGSAVQRFDGATGAFIDEFVAFGSGGLDSPFGLTFGPDGNLYVVNQTFNQVLRYDGTTGAFIDVFVGTALDQPAQLTFGPDGNLYVVNQVTASVSRYDAATGSFIDNFVAPAAGGLGTPFDLAFGPDGNLYVSSGETNEVLRYNGATGAFIDAFVTAGSGGVGFPEGITFGPDGNLYVANEQTGSLLRYDGTTGAFIDVYVPEFSGGLFTPQFLRFGPDGNLYATSTAKATEILRYVGFIDNTATASGNEPDPDALNDTGSAGIDVQAPTGACCQFGGICSIETQDDCDNMEASYQGDGTTCDPFPCPVKCCLPDGSCFDQTTDDCLANGGQPELPGSSCFSDGPVCPPVGACCDSDGENCTQVTEFACAASGGTFLGAGMSCDLEACLGACCQTDGTCQDGFAQEGCETSAGTWQGPATFCGQITCPGGACCLADGTCSDESEQFACESSAGTWQGAGTECASVSCPQPGACCQFGGICSIETEDDCNNMKGSFQGVGTGCDPFPCAVKCCLPDGSCSDETTTDCIAQGGQPEGAGSSCFSDGGICPPVGACCQGGGGCVTLTEFGCDGVGGTFLGIGTECSAMACAGACCFEPVGDCLDVSVDGCASFGGNFQGFGTECVSTVCEGTLGACCYGDACSDETQFQCENVLGGTFIGFETTCVDDPCPRRCCLSDGSCTETDFADCLAQGGDPGPLSSDCKGAECSQPGACCFDDDTCLEIAEFACLDAGGSFQGEFSSCATDCTGACCDVSGVCTVVTQGMCLQTFGVFQGNNTTCDPNPCFEACCFGDGMCADLSSDDCLNSGGQPQGLGSQCATAFCEPFGGCCFSDGSCAIEESLVCGKLGGQYQGDGSTCGVSVCPGACCYTDGTCTELPEFDCDKTGGVFEGDGISCDNEPCPPRGACCLLDGTCTFTFASDCAASLGVFRGVGIPCLDFVCPDPGAVLDEAKIADGVGGFTGFLNSNANFGAAVTGLGDLNGDGARDIAVGATTIQTADGSAFWEGAVWVLLLNPDGSVAGEVAIGSFVGGFGGSLDVNDAFGASIAAIGDLDDDGVVDLAVGAFGDDDNNDGLTGDTSYGAVWILFMNADGTVKAEQKISELQGGFTGDLATFENFGISVSGLGDLDGDSVPDLAVGAPGYTTGGADGFVDSGSVWILLMNDDGTVKANTRIAQGEGGFGGALSSFDSFGTSIGALGDLDDDGTVDLVVGAPGDDDGGPSRGAAWILLLNEDGTVKAEQKISSNDVAGIDDGDFFGTSVVGLDDLDGDGSVDLAVGAPFDDDAQAGNGPDTNRGAVYILLLLPDGSVKYQRKISDTESDFDGVLSDGDWFGGSLGALGDLDGDGVAELGVGATGDDTGGLDHGAAWVLFLDGDAQITFSDPTEFVAAGDLNEAAVGELDGSLAAPFALDMGPVPECPESNGPDVAVLLSDADLVQIFLNAGTVAGQWQGFIDPALTFDAGPTPTDLALADFNGDGYNDIAVANGPANTVTILFNAGCVDPPGPMDPPPGTFPFDATLTGFSNASAIAAANFVGGPAIDLAVANMDTDTVVILENDGAGGFTPIADGLGGGISVGSGPMALDPIDGDNDKDFDLLAGGWDIKNPSASVTYIVNEDGSDVFTPTPEIPVGRGPIDLASGDIDGNSFEDPVASNGGDSSVTVLFNAGPSLGNGETPLFDSTLTLLVGAEPQSVDVADFDGDGDLDIAVTAVDLIEGPSVQVLENLLDETDEPEFEPPVAVDVIGDPVAVVNGDMDGNGLPDIVTANDDEDVPDDGSVTVVLSIPEVFCDTDFDGSGATDFGDLLTLLGNWGRCTDETQCPGDINADSVVDFADLLLLIQGFGPCE